MDGRANRGKDGRAATGANRFSIRIMPWGISLVFHAGVAAAAAMVALAVVPDRARELVAPDAILARQPAERIATFSRTSPVGLASARMDEMGPTARSAEPMHSGRMGDGRQNLLPLGPSAGGLAAFGPVALGPGACGPEALGSTSLGPAAFRAPPRSSLLGAGGNAHHVVYVLDRSGSMIDTFEEVRRAVLLSIGRLGNDQDFHVILFAQGKAIENAPRRLVPPTEACKLQAAEFLAAARAGFQSDPLPALHRALDVLEEAGGGGKLIYLLSDGMFPNAPAVLAALRGRNKDLEVRIHTYFCGGDASGKALLKEIARSNGGLFRQVGADAEK